MRFLLTVAVSALALPAFAVTSPHAVPSPLVGSGQNVTFDGRLFVSETGNGWDARLLVPEKVTYKDGFPVVTDAFTKERTILGPTPGRNGLALCEEAPQPVACKADGTTDTSGDHACYNLVVFNAEATGPVANFIGRRTLRVVVSAPKTKDAAIKSHTWLSEPTAVDDSMSGIEPTFTRDGKLVVWNGSTDDTGEGYLVYSVNDTPCGATGWAPAKHIGAMNTDPRVHGKYKIAEKPMRAPDGTIYGPNDPIVGAYPWLFPDGEALNSTAAYFPCRKPPGPFGCGAVDAPCTQAADPLGCGVIRNAISVIGYPTNWTLAHADGAINPDTDETVRLFFTSPQPTNAKPLPATHGVDVWPFFGTNTSNYTELVFDDGLDGNYGGLWHMNELVAHDNGAARNRTSHFDYQRIADSSGYFNTGWLPETRTPNSGLLGTTQTFNGLQRVNLGHGMELTPAQAMTIQLDVYPTANLDCDDKNNWRFLLSKGSFDTGSYSIVMEEDHTLFWRLTTAAGVRTASSRQSLPLNRWTTVTFSYDGVLGEMAVYVNGSNTERLRYGGSPMVGSSDDLLVGLGPVDVAACPDGVGGFVGQVDGLTITNHATPSMTPAMIPAKNNGLLGKALVFNGTSDVVRVPHSSSLNPTNALTLQAAVKPASGLDCDGGDNTRVVVQKGTLYQLVVHDDGHFAASVRVAGGAIYSLTSHATLAAGEWSALAVTYDASSGKLALFLNGLKDNEGANAPALLDSGAVDLFMGGPGTAQPACPTDGLGAFAGAIDEVSVSSIVRDLTPPPEPTLTEGPPESPATPKKKGCQTAASELAWIAVATLVALRRRR